MTAPHSSPRPGVPTLVDTTKASIARVYDYALGGKDNYPVDREVIDRTRAFAPEIEEFARDHRAFLIRATRFLAGQAGISQFLDCGSGLPTAENTHQAAQRVNPDAKVVYVDNDPSVIAHGRALLEENTQTFFCPADIFVPRAVLDDPLVTRNLDLTQPVALYQVGTLHHYVESAHDRPAADLMQEYIDALAPGSYVVIGHFFDPENEDTELARRMENIWVNSPMGSGVFRTRSELLALLPGLDVVPPGLTVCAEWWPDGPQLHELKPAQRCIAGVVARKP